MRITDERLIPVVARALSRKRTHLHVTGPLLQKRRRHSWAASYHQLIAEQLSKSEWRFRPKAKIAICLRLFSGELQPPSLLRVAKFWLDLLEGLAFRDDRQVRYLQVEQVDFVRAITPSRTLITLQTLTDYNRSLELYFDRVPETAYYKTSGILAHPEDSLEELPALLDPRARAFLRSLEAARLQRSLLECNRIGYLNRPSIPGAAAKHLVAPFSPLVIDMGVLPKVGESTTWLRLIRERLVQIQESGHPLQELEIPLELDVQIVAGARVNKDLDNLGLDMLSAFTDSFSEMVRFGGYRTYVTRVSDTLDRPRVMLRLLPPGAIAGFHKAVEVSLEDLQDAL